MMNQETNRKDKEITLGNNLTRAEPIRFCRNTMETDTSERSLETYFLENIMTYLDDVCLFERLPWRALLDIRFLLLALVAAIFALLSDEL
jgi:hypothetical protein